MEKSFDSVTPVAGIVIGSCFDLYARLIVTETFAKDGEFIETLLALLIGEMFEVRTERLERDDEDIPVGEVLPSLSVLSVFMVDAERSEASDILYWVCAQMMMIRHKTCSGCWLVRGEFGEKMWVKRGQSSLNSRAKKGAQ
mmetsp:Transcript_9331/g.34551  ORF Transcript_9331/g.34551 Transcript_9331/m.34551 type:complete len:141 (-) Transcript_9331:2101-2523(-)